MNSSIFIGSFNAEKFWKDTNYASLPSFQDIQADLIVETMDEMQFVFSKTESDFLVSSFAMNTVHKNYLHELGFKFRNNEKDIKTNIDDGRSIFEALILSNIEKTFSIEDVHLLTISPYAVLPCTSEFCSTFEIMESFPSIDVIKIVNSKVFSSQISRCFSQHYSHLINSVEELELKGEMMLRESPVILKDPFGVSGKGNLYIDKSGILKRTAKYLKKQEDEGKKVQFIVENYLEKKSDFSCQFHIDKKGSIQIMSVQQMENKNFSFNSIKSSENEFIKYLEKRMYFFQVEEIAKILFKQGYHGPVCLDSMVLINGDIIPVVEINARKSMGMINYHIDKYLDSFNVKGQFITLSCVLNKPVSFDTLFNTFQKKDILFTVNKPFGIIPISSNTFDINTRINSDYPTKGRLYITLVKGPDENNLMCSLNKVFLELDVKLLS